MLHSPPPILHFTIHHRSQRTEKRRHNCRCNDRRRICASVLAPVRNHIYRNKLQRRNIKYKKSTHFIAGFPYFSLFYILCIPSFLLNFDNASIAFNPAGVHAHPSPKILAIILVEIYSRASCPFGIPGNRKEING